jgi:hypothetical protein
MDTAPGCNFQRNPLITEISGSDNFSAKAATPHSKLRTPDSELYLIGGRFLLRSLLDFDNKNTNFTYH